MSDNNQKPKLWDAVLGGQNQPKPYDAVLGKIKQITTTQSESSSATKKLNQGNSSEKSSKELKVTVPNNNLSNSSIVKNANLDNA
ncbi:MAG: hypothetical protein ACKOX2_08390, partial [Microcystaceae cyanobacterium]